MRAYLTETLLASIERFRGEFSSRMEDTFSASLSIKTTWRNLYGEEEKLLLCARRDDASGDFPPPEDWAVLRLESVRKLVELRLNDPGLVREGLRNSLAVSSSAPPPMIALLHAVIPLDWAVFSLPRSLEAGFYLKDGFNKIASLFGADHVIPFAPELPSQCFEIRRCGSKDKGVVIFLRGLVAWGRTMEECLKNYQEWVQLAANILPALPELEEPFSSSPAETFELLTAVRSRASAAAGRPLVVGLDSSSISLNLLSSSEAVQAYRRGALTPATLALTGLPVEVGEQEAELPVGADSAAGEPAWPRLFFFPGIGAAVASSSPQAGQLAAIAFRRTAAACLAAFQAGGVLGGSPDEIAAALKWEEQEPIEQLPLSGEIALVTGAASGIGKGCAEALLRRGCAVVGLDINPAIREVFHHPAYLGIVCDITDEASVRASIQEIVRRFGGLDIMILNAGMFPPGCHIRALSLGDFNKVMRVNLDANLTLMREAYPLLKSAPRYGRVVMIGSKNMKAPGPGAAAYSCSKAALTQLARVAALEWGEDRIRVNVLHPDAVFDTALYTEEVLKARAAHYGVTVEQYKKRNLLKTEITSRAVGEMAAEMCGPLFEHVTGAQIQMDGGNDRTI